MFVVAKFLHLFGVVVAIGFGLANLVIMARSISAAREARKYGISIPKPNPEIMALQKRNSRIGFAGLVLIWVSGIWIYLDRYALAALNGPFHWKIAFVILLTALAVWAQLLLWRAEREGAPPPRKPMQVIAITVPSLGILAILLAILSFTS